jgi:hypothetical protein
MNTQIMSQPILRTVTRRCARNVLAIPKTASANSILIAQRRLLHSSQSTSAAYNPFSSTETRHKAAAPVPPEPAENPAVGLAPNPDDNVGQKKLADFDLSGRVFIVTGGARGLGLSLAEALVETGGKGESPHDHARQGAD